MSQPPQKSRWLPLESNPDVMNKFAQKLGMPEEWQYVDIYSLDLLDIVPKPVAAVLILFPISKKYEDFCKEEQTKIEQDGQEVSPNLMFIKQTIGNACGTIALLHSIANNTEKMQLSGFLSNFIEKTKSMTPEERASFLESDEGLCAAHEESAQEGQTEPPPREEHTELHFLTLVSKDGYIYEMDGRKQHPVNHGPTTDEAFLQARDEEVNLHFISLVHMDGHLYEMDGRKPNPINHGKSSKETLLEDAAAVCQKFMNRDKAELRFTLIALSKNPDL